jgi:hypothetical protein
MVEPNTLETTEAAAAIHRPLLLEIVLQDGERIHGLVDDEVSRAEVGTLHTRLATEPFVLIGERTVVRSADVRSVQLHDSEARGGAPIARQGGRRMTNYEQDSETTGMGGGARVMRGGGQRGGSQQRGRRSGQPAVMQNYGYGRRPYAETKPFFLTSEFLAFLGILVALAIALGATDSLNQFHGWVLITAIGCAYIVSRGIAKAGTRDPNIGGGSDQDYDYDDDTSYYGRD